MPIVKQRIYKFRPAAQDDLEERALYLLLNVSDAAMIRFLRSVYRTCNLLTGMPYLGQKVEGDADLREFGVRGFRGTRLIYLVSPGVIEIVRAVGRNQHWIP